jgi:hypothetical protein
MAVNSTMSANSTVADAYIFGATVRPALRIAATAGGIIYV